MKFTEEITEEITDEMPASRAYRIRARAYTATAYELLLGKSGLTPKEQRKHIKTAAKYLNAATADLAAALEAHKN